MIGENFESLFSPMSNPVDIRQLLTGVGQNVLINANALKTALEGLAPGTEVLFPSLSKPITIIGAGTNPFQKATIYRFESAIELPGEIGLCGPGHGNGRVILRTGPGFTDTQMVRNWKSTDWQSGRIDESCGVTNGSAVVTDAGCVISDVGKLVRDSRASTASGLGYPFGIPAATTIISVTPGVSFTMSTNYVGATSTISCMIGEPDHLIAPNKTVTSLYYPRIHDIGFDVNGASNVACIGRVHPQEQALIARVSYWNTQATGTGNYGRIDSNNSEGGIAGIQVCEGEVSYGGGWVSMILQDGTCGGKVKPTYPGGGTNLRDTTTAVSSTNEKAYSSSPLKFIAMSVLTLGPIHQEAFSTNEGTKIIFTDGSVVSGSNVLTTGKNIIFSGHHVGRSVTDSEGAIPAGTIITKYLTTSTVEMSNIATATKNPDTITLGPDDACIRSMDCSGIKYNDLSIATHYETTRPWIRNTASGTAPGSIPISSPLIIGGKLATTPGSHAEWTVGTSIIEDYPGDGLLRLFARTSETFDPRQIQRYDGNEFRWANGATPEYKRSQVSSRSVPDNEIWSPARNKFLAANGDPGMIIPTSNTLVKPISGVLTLSWVPTPWNMKLSKLWYYIAEQSGNTFTSGQNFVGAYNGEGKLIAKTGDLSASWGAAETVVENNVTVALWQNIGAPLTVIGTGVWFALLANGTLVNFKFYPIGAGNINANLSSSGTLRAGTYGSALTALPTTIIPGNIISASNSMWAALS